MKTSDVKASKCQLKFSPRIIGEIIKILKIKINFFDKKIIKLIKLVYLSSVISLMLMKKSYCH